MMGMRARGALCVTFVCSAFLLFCFPVKGKAQAATSTTVSLTLTQNGAPVTRATAGSVVTLTATVAAANGTTVSPGQVQFCDADAPSCTDIHLLGVATLSSAGVARLNTVAKRGAHIVKAVFNGTHTYSASRSAPLLFSGDGSVGATKTTTTLTAQGAPGNYTLTATVLRSGATAPSGTVDFVDTTNGNWSFGSSPLGAAANGLQLIAGPVLATPNIPPDNIGGDIQKADFNGDGIPDLALCSSTGYSFTSPGNLSVFLGKGDGTFTTLPPVPAGLDPESFGIGDVNGDGVPDVIVTAAGSALATVLLGNGDGTFRAGSSFSVGPPNSAFVYSTVIGDVDGDGVNDVAFILPFPQTVYLYHGNGDGTFTLLPRPLATDFNPLSLVEADFNGDGIPDIALVTLAKGSVTDPSTLEVYLGHGDGTFDAPREIRIGAGAEIIVPADVNGDGKLDLVVGEIGVAPGAYEVLLGNGDASFKSLGPQQVVYIGGVTVGDFNGDGVPDLALALENTAVGQNVQILQGIGDGTFVATSAQATDADVPAPLVAADFNGDGYDDLAVTDQGSSVKIFLTAVTGSATATLSGVSPIGQGTHYAQGVYSGDQTYAGGSSNLVRLQAVLQPTATQLAADSSTSNHGQAVTLTATVSPNPVQMHAPGGSVTFFSNNISLGQASVSGGSATLTTSALVSGSDTLTATYGGDDNFAGSMSNALPHTVSGGIATTIVASESPNPSTYSQPVVFVAKVSVTGTIPVGTPAPTGFVLFAFCRGATVRAAIDATGTATFVTPVPGAISDPVGTCPYTAQYLGDALYLSSTSSPVDYTVTPARSTTVISGQPNPQFATRPVAFTVTVHGIPSPSFDPSGNILQPGSQSATGTVQILDGTAVVGSGVLNASGQAVVSVTWLTAGQHTVSANYLGDTDLLGSVSAGISETILPLDYALTSNAPSITIQTEHKKSMLLTLDTTNGFAGDISLVCGAPVPDFLTCELPATSISVKAGTKTPVLLTMDTDAVLNFHGSDGADNQVIGAALGVLGLFMLVCVRKKKGVVALAIVLLACTAGLSSCSSKWPGHTPPGTYGIQVDAVGRTPEGVAITHSTQVTLIVTP